MTSCALSFSLLPFSLLFLCLLSFSLLSLDLFSLSLFLFSLFPLNLFPLSLFSLKSFSLNLFLFNSFPINPLLLNQFLQIFSLNQRMHRQLPLRYFHTHIIEPFNPPRPYSVFFRLSNSNFHNVLFFLLHQVLKYELPNLQDPLIFLNFLLVSLISFPWIIDQFMHLHNKIVFIDCIVELPPYLE